MGFPPNADRVMQNNMATPAGALSFEMQAPHGARIYATQKGCRIDFAAEHREHVFAWLQSELQRLETFGAAQEELVQCPDCKSTMKMVNNLPVFCQTCKGMGRVTKTKAAAYLAAQMPDVSPIAPPVPTEIRPPSFAPLTMDTQGSPVPVPKVLVGKVQPDTDEDFVAPRPGQEGFIGPLQQRS